MINRHRLDYLFAEMEYCFRKYGRAVKLHKDTVDKAMIHAMKDQTVPDDIKEIIENTQWDMEYYSKEFEQLKTTCIDMIKAIELPSIG